MHYREICNNTAVVQNPGRCFSFDMAGNFIGWIMGNSGIQETGPMVAPAKGNQALSFAGRGANNRHIR